MFRSVIAASIALGLISAVAEAHARPRLKPVQTICNKADLMRPCSRDENFLKGIRSINIEMRRERTEQNSSRLPNAGSLASKVREIELGCGAKVISGRRHTMIAGTRRLSLHASGKAVDMVGNPSCIYGHLVGWPGGYSTDYGRVRHVHISLDVAGGREMGLRFRHGVQSPHWRRSFARGR